MEANKILAIETSSDLCSVSVSFDINKFDERNLLLKNVHSERLIPIIAEILKSNNLSTEELYCISVSIGPGSFTGLRIGLTAAKGIAFASGLPLVPVPTFDAFALEIGEYLPNDTEFYIINKANTEESYIGKYKSSENEIIRSDEASLIKNSELHSLINNNSVIFGNLKDLEGIKPIGSPRASSIAKWTYLFGEDLLTFNYDYIEPNYLKKFKIRKIK